MKYSKIGFLVLLIVSIVMIGLAIKQRARIIKMEQKLQDQDIGIQIERLVNCLRMPSEALYYNHDAIRKICEIRYSSFLKIGVKKFLPYRNVAGRRFDKPILELKKGSSAGYGDSIYFPPDYSKIREGVSLENYWLNQVDHSLSLVSNAFRSDTEVGKYLASHPEYFERVFQPWLERLTKCTHPDISLQACDILLKKGKRTETVKNSLKRIIDRDPNLLYMNDVGYSKKAKAYNMKYKLGIYTENDKKSVEKKDPNS
jgi:hypothetical protein